MKILVVEPDAPLRGMLKIYLEEIHGAEVTTIGSVPEGMEALRNGDYSLILMDSFTFEPQEFVSFVTELNRIKGSCERLIIFRALQNWKPPMNCNALAILPKPFDLESLSEIIDGLVQ